MNIEEKKPDQSKDQNDSKKQKEEKKKKDKGAEKSGQLEVITPRLIIKPFDVAVALRLGLARGKAVSR